MFGIIGGVAVGLKHMSALFISLVEALPVCPTYTLLQSGHVSLYMPERMYLSGVTCFCINHF